MCGSGVQLVSSAHVSSAATGPRIAQAHAQWPAGEAAPSSGLLPGQPARDWPSGPVLAAWAGLLR